MKKTVLITGTSSGIGKATVLEFAKMGWNVIATQRNPEKEKDFDAFPNVKMYSLDVTNLESIKQTISQVQRDYGKIDVVVNNAGYGVDGAFEAMSDEIIEKQFNTNVFGLMRVTREAIKHMRPNGGGMIIQISSMGGKITFPLYSIYHATKFAVEGFADSLLPVLDSLEAGLAIQSATPDQIREGAEATLRQLKSAMERNKIVAIDPSAGAKFDPAQHQAISVVPADQEANTVVTVLQKGYLIAERVLRPALVTVAAPK